ncbi:MAG TPA: response regulator transcription factor [Candidatus Faecousia faecavium]|nr:response regulator transcription factor [Candidatus Faecousia faecavium]
MKQRILIAEDEADIRNILKLYLESEGFEVVQAQDGDQALRMAQQKMPDLILLDVMMPNMDGFAVTQALRQYSQVPILILSARSQDADKILGLNLGADDYIAKPFNALEVVARVKAHLRRGQQTVSPVINLNGLTLNSETCTVTKDGTLLSLTPTEYKLLSVFMRSPGRIFTKVQLSEAINGEYFESDENTIMVHISKLRDKIEDNPRKPARLVTIRGLGYRFEKT